MFSSALFRSFMVCCLTLCLSASATAKVEAVRGKRYRLSPNHGPWMIMVAALRDVPEERRTEGGMTAWQAADQLVYELRRLGIPAYTYLQTMEMQQVKGLSSGPGKTTEGKYISRHEAIAVVAGNFSSPDQREAKVILKYLKEDFEPKFLDDEDNGAIFARTPGRPNPLSRAHLTTNPLMPASEVKSRSMDPLIRQLNANMEYSLFRNKGRYSLRVATFKGSAIVQVGNRVNEKAQKNFDKIFGSNLDEAGTKAWELTEALRSASKLGFERNYDAWVFHDRYESYVTIGSFNTPDDPRIAVLAKQFKGKNRTHEGQEVLTAEVFTIPRNVPIGEQPDKFWMFDVTPKLVEVPRIRR